CCIPSVFPVILKTQGRKMAFPKVGINEMTSKITHIYKQLHPWKSKFDCASFLCQQMVHAEDGVFAINKPYGMGLKTVTEEMISKKKEKKSVDLLHAGGAGSTYSLEDVLPIIREQLGKPNLVAVKCAEKYNSGVTVFADNKKAVDRIKQSLLRAKPKKILNSKFYIVSPFTPYEGHKNLHEESVGITLQRNAMHKHAQPVLLRDFSTNSVKRQEVSLARVAFNVKSISPDGESLVEVSMAETKNNLLRVYCADMLMPILGDHLYSSRVGVVQGLATRLNPLHVESGSVAQKIPEKTRKLLQLIRPEDSNIVPLHAHLYSLVLPDFYGRDKELTISAPFPEMFKWTCNQLNLICPQNGH
ncbi:unnamed protein product, partial [Allacma fusca]